MTNHPVTLALSMLLQNYAGVHPCLRAPYDPDWHSPCECSDEDDQGLVQWRPVKRESADDFAGLEAALACQVHADIKAYYGSFWSGTVEAVAEEGLVNLLFLWNAEDGDQLVENMIGHALQKQRQRLPLTLFFACTEPDSELFLSLDNQSGEVLLEHPAKAPIKTVAPSLVDFINRLTPAKTLQNQNSGRPGSTAVQQLVAFDHLDDGLT